jgi:prepilin-type N-terminal cleavage/methylation domain-containing protein
MGDQRIFKKRGFTLIEIMVAVALIVIGITAVVKTMSTALLASSVIDIQATALSLAQEKMQEIKNASTYAAVDGYATAAVSVTGFTAYTREVLVSAGPPKQVTVNVNLAIKSQTITVSLVTLIANTFS